MEASLSTVTIVRRRVLVGSCVLVGLLWFSFWVNPLAAGESQDPAMQIAAKYLALGYYLHPIKGADTRPSDAGIDIPVSLGLEYIFIANVDEGAAVVEISVTDKSGNVLVRDH